MGLRSLLVVFSGCLLIAACSDLQEPSPISTSHESLDASKHPPVGPMPEELRRRMNPGRWVRGYPDCALRVHTQERNSAGELIVDDTRILKEWVKWAAPGTSLFYGSHGQVLVQVDRFVTKTGNQLEVRTVTVVQGAVQNDRIETYSCASYTPCSEGEACGATVFAPGENADQPSHGGIVCDCD